MSINPSLFQVMNRPKYNLLFAENGPQSDLIKFKYSVSKRLTLGLTSLAHKEVKLDMF